MTREQNKLAADSVGGGVLQRGLVRTKRVLRAGGGDFRDITIEQPSRSGDQSQSGAYTGFHGGKSGSAIGEP
jgi:hypothetical protein